MTDKLTDRTSPFGNDMMVDAKEIAAFMGCSPKHIRRLADDGRMPRSIKIGRLHRWHRQDIEKWLAAQASGGAVNG